MNITELTTILELLSKIKTDTENHTTTNNPKTSDHTTFKAGKHIVILQRGWIVVGDLHQAGTSVTVENASVIRVWGTTKGLGELALNGPLETTKLDPCGTVVAHELTVVATIKCEESKW